MRLAVADLAFQHGQALRSPGAGALRMAHEMLNSVILVVCVFWYSASRRKDPDEKTL